MRPNNPRVEAREWIDTHLDDISPLAAHIHVVDAPALTERGAHGRVVQRGDVRHRASLDVAGGLGLDREDIGAILEGTSVLIGVDLRRIRENISTLVRSDPTSVCVWVGCECGWGVSVGGV